MNALSMLLEYKDIIWYDLIVRNLGKEGNYLNGQYQIEYRLNGVSCLFELYLFVNPLGRHCYVSEQELLKVIDMVSTNIDFHILPFHNQDLVESFMSQSGVKQANLQDRNKIFQAIYRASLAYKAASLQGKKVGRHYLMRMQESIRGEINRFTTDLSLDLAQEVGLDIETFYQDIQSDFVKQLFFKDQKIAVDMKVHDAPSLVIFEYLSGDSQVLTNQPITVETILVQLDLMSNRCIQHIENAGNSQPNLRLL